MTTITNEVVASARNESLFTTEAVPVRTQLVRDTTTGAVCEWGIYDRAMLVPDTVINGPAIVAEDETSTLVGPGWTATVNGLGYIELSRSSGR